MRFTVDNELNIIDNEIKDLKLICADIQENYFDDKWELTDQQQERLYEITSIESHYWDENVLAHYIDGMQNVARRIKRIHKQLNARYDTHRTYLQKTNNDNRGKDNE